MTLATSSVLGAQASVIGSELSVYLAPILFLALIHECPRRSQPVENPLYTPSEPFSGSQNPRHRSVLALMSKCLDAVWDYPPVLYRLFQQARALPEVRLYSSTKLSLEMLGDLSSETAPHDGEQVRRVAQGHHRVRHPGLASEQSLTSRLDYCLCRLKADTPLTDA